MQGIIVPSDGRSGGLAMLWKEGTNVGFKSCSNSHIDMVIREGATSISWQATRFYSQPKMNKRFISWQLLEVLRAQHDLSWIVFRDFNKIAYPNEKL